MLYLTSCCSPSRAIVEAVASIVALGITNIELTGGTLYEHYDLSALRALKTKHNLNFLIHNYFPPQSEEFVLNPASTNPEIRSRVHQTLADSISLAQSFGHNLYSLHAGFSYDQIPIFRDDGLFTPMSGPRFCRDNLYEGVERIAATILPPEVNLALENAFPLSKAGRFSLMASPEDILAFLERFADSKNVGLLLDLGHLNLSACRLGFDKIAFLDRLLGDWGHKIFEVHASANNGEHDSHNLNTVDDFEIQFIKGARKILEHAPIILEWHDCLSQQAAETYFDIARYLDLIPSPLDANP
ncbi:MAG: sugar phosphate isomerase/epimerase [Desulfovibrio sp.]|nr:sugar phosphate isomerase/epimerase [Desulfovibrio sp.]MBI4959172.1 sugar phosphate isomerase/epimerase [Desulfovibrio sp.]